MNIFILSVAAAAALIASIVPFADAHGADDDAPFLRSRELSPQQVADAHFAANVADFDLTADDIGKRRVVNEFTTKHNGITHLYYAQTIEGIDVANAAINVNVDRSGQLIGRVRSSFVTNLATKASAIGRQPTITAADAISCSVLHLGDNQKDLGRERNRRLHPDVHYLSPKLPAASSPAQEEYKSDTHHLSPKLISSSEGPAQESTFHGDGISQDEITAKLVYYHLGSGDIELAWELKLNTLDQKFWGNVWVDAHSSDCTVLDECNWITGADEQYEVFGPLPKESPSEGDRTIVTHPADPLASPFGWHDVDGVEGSEYTTTRGNNVCAQTDLNADNSDCGTENPPDGGPSLDFTGALVPLDLSTQEPNEYQNAAVVNLFYHNNIMHDILYHYGFDEISGNFQQNNYGRGGREGDAVTADAQDGSGTNNANFFTPPDGSPPRMQMYRWDSPFLSGLPDRDSDFDNGVIAHEYCHGLSMRLTGGAQTSNCLNNKNQQGGEGWSDVCLLFVTAVASDTRDTPRGVGTYVKFQPSDGPGIRPYPYSTDMDINPLTYGDITTGSLSIPHGIGSVWATAVWELYWDMVDAYGFGNDLYTGTGGNNMAFQLMVDGLKLQGCHPTFLDARDAILAADEANNGGVNECLIWGGFAKRGMGYSAYDGGSASSFDVEEAFDLPPQCRACAEDEVCDTGNVCSVDTCGDDGTCVSTITDDCCGNSICEAGEQQCTDCGPFKLLAPHDGYWVPREMMFDISAIDGIILNGLSFRMYCQPTSDCTVQTHVTVYTASGSYAQNLGDPSSWTEVARQSISAEPVDWVSIEFEGNKAVNINNGTTQAIYISLSSDSIIAGRGTSDPTASDDNVIVDFPAFWVTEPFVNGTSTPRDGESITWEGSITYDIQTICIQDSNCDDNNACTVDTCNDGTCVNTITDNCCGNFVCEEGEEQECAADCGPFELIAPPCNKQSCWLPSGLMFDVSAIKGIILNGLSFRVYCQGFFCTVNSVVTIYTASGSYIDKYNDSLAWTEVTSQSISASRYSWVSLTFEGVDINIESTQAIYISLSSDRIFASKGTLDPTASDDNVIIDFPAFLVTEPFVNGTSTPRNGETGETENISLEGSITYNIQQVNPVDSPTDNPSKPPTRNPITESPSATPSKAPTPPKAPPAPDTDSPTKLPSASPVQATNRPTANPSKPPTLAPVSMEPSQPPTLRPTGSPSKMPSVSPVTQEPSAPPTLRPSKSQSNSPTSSPTSPSPTSSPSSNPTPNPSMAPTGSPTNNPTANPSKAQTQAPSEPGQPTSMPSGSPSVSAVPSSQPSENPSVSDWPSESPSTSAWPSKKPTSPPTNRPTATPSKAPSVSPSKQLTSSPTTSPLSSPSKQPTNSPTVHPSKAPSKAPSGSPSKAPTTPPTTAQPTANPSEAPSKAPSGSPSKAPTPPKAPPAPVTNSPTSPPTQAPTTSPSKDPTASPSKVPTHAPIQASNAPTQSPTSTAKWYINWNDLRCQQDCIGSHPCGGKAPSLSTLYDTVEECCADSFSSPHLVNQCVNLSL